MEVDFFSFFCLFNLKVFWIRGKKEVLKSSFLN